MKGVLRSAIAIIPLTTVSALFLSPSHASPLAAPSSSIAQVESTVTPNPSLPTMALDVGTQIPVILPGGNPDANLVMSVGESFETSFEVAADVLDSQNNVIIPQGSTITGVFAPKVVRQRQGTRFKAKQVTIGNQSYDLQATSAPFAAKRRNQITANDVRSSVSTIAAATVVDSLFNRVGRAAGVDRRIIRGAKRGAGVGGVLPTVLKTGQQLTQKANSPGEVIVVNPNELGLTLDTVFQNASSSTPATTQAVAPSGLILASGTNISLKATSPGTRYIVDANESFPVELRIANDIADRQNTIVIPKGSVIKGNLTPSTSGSVFRASQVVMGGRTYALDAQTAIISPTEVSTLSPANLRGNTVTSPKASNSLAKVKSEGSGSGGGFLGQLLGTRTQNQVIIFDPAATPLQLTSDFSIGT